MDRWEIFFRWMLQTNQDARDMEVLSTQVECSGISDKTETQGTYETVNSGACKTCHGSPNSIAKGCGNKGGRYTSTYAPGSCHKKNCF